MRGLASFLLAVISLPALGQDRSVEIAGIAVQKGMPVDELRAVIPDYAIHPIEIAEGVTENLEIWSVHNGQWADGGEIIFRGGRVYRATRNLYSSNDRETYDLFAQLGVLLYQLTGGEDTCVMIRASIPQQIFPQTDTTFILPNKIISVGTADRGEGSKNVSISESTRVNRVPEAERVQSARGDSEQCVLRDAS